MISLLLDGTPGWRKIAASPDECLWAKGYLHGRDFDSLLSDLQALSAEDVPGWINQLDGHFALVWQGSTFTFAAVDPIASIPLCYRSDTNSGVKASTAISIASSARRLLKTSDVPDAKAVLTLAMAGFTIGDQTLFGEIQQLGCGSVLLVVPGQPLQRHHYHRYLPQPTADTTPTLRHRLRDLTMTIIETMMAGLKDRPIIVPLSAGLDSRLIVSALKEAGYASVICVSYGRAGNHEAKAAQKIARHLGYPWHFIAHTPRQQAETFSSADCKDFIEFADNIQAIPFQQDFHAVATAQRSGIAPPEAVFINGQSGDFIAGNHIPRSLFPPESASVFEATVKKHFGMWESLKTPENITLMQRLFEHDARQYKPEDGSLPEGYALYEASEYYNRQSKYVVAGQRTYEWFGYDWRLPLWDRAYIDFWETAPLEAKVGQRLYRDMLSEANWGGVWGDDWHFPQTVVPSWMRPIRFAAKAAHVFKGQAAWHRFEKNWIAWFTDPVANYAIAPYQTVRRDKRGHRNAISWHVAQYLADKGIEIRADGTLSGI